MLESASSCSFRSMILIYMVLGTERFTEFDAHYFPDAQIAITPAIGAQELRPDEPARQDGIMRRAALLPDRRGVERERPGSGPVDDGRARPPAGLPVSAKVLEVASRRLPQAYPLYTREYREHFDRIDGWLNGIDGILTFGRQGLFAHDNTHHALAMAYAVSECLDDAGVLNRARWHEHRRAFQHHVVED